MNLKDEQETTVCMTLSPTANTLPRRKANARAIKQTRQLVRMTDLTIPSIQTAQSSLGSKAISDEKRAPTSTHRMSASLATNALITRSITHVTTSNVDQLRSQRGMPYRHH